MAKQSIDASGWSSDNKAVRTVARVADAVAVGVQLVGVVHVGAVVAGAADEVVISVGTTRVEHLGVPACIAHAVADGVCLRRVVRAGTCTDITIHSTRGTR